MAGLETFLMLELASSDPITARVIGMLWAHRAS